MTVDRRRRPASRARRQISLSTPSGATLVALGVIALLASVFIGSQTSAQSDQDQPSVYVISITGTIDLGLAPYLERVLDDAEDAGAPAVILEIDTPGGRLDAVLQMKDALLDAEVPTIAFVNRTAFSAGALIAIVAFFFLGSLYMAVLFGILAFQSYQSLQARF